MILRQPHRAAVARPTRFTPSLERACDEIEARPVNDPGPPAPRTASPRPARRQLRVLQRQYDHAVRDQAADTSCRPGCDACCYQAIRASYLEAEVMLDVLVAQEGEAALVALATACVERRDLCEGMSVEGYWQARLPCVLLRDRRCRVYNVRPASCRIYFVTTPPALCGVRPVAVIGMLSTPDASDAFDRGLHGLQLGRLRALHLVLLEALADRGVKPPPATDAADLAGPGGSR